MTILKKHIKKISIVIISSGAVVSLGGLITFLVTGTYNVIELTGTKTNDNQTEYLTAALAAGWLNFDSYHWTNVYGEINEYGKKEPLTFNEFIKKISDKNFIDNVNSTIESEKQLQANSIDELAKIKYQYSINYYEGILNANFQYTISIVGCALFAGGIIIALLITMLLIIIQKKHLLKEADEK